MTDHLGDAMKMLRARASERGPAVIAELARLHAAHGKPLGKTALQKEIYFLQTLFDVDCGYQFTLYTYGPFTSEILADLDTLRSCSAVTLSFEANRPGYQISPSTNLAHVQKQHKAFLREHRREIEHTVEEFGDELAKSLELNATIVYVEREKRRHVGTPAEDEVVGNVYRLKPHFSEQTIRKALVGLQSRGYVTTTSLNAAADSGRKAMVSRARV